MMALAPLHFCPCDGRQAGLWYLPARWRDTTHRWVSGVSDGLAHPLWAVGAAASSSSQRAKPEAPLDAAAAAALRASGEDGTASAPRRCTTPCGAWLPGGHQLRAGSPG